MAGIGHQEATWRGRATRGWKPWRSREGLHLGFERVEKTLYLVRGELPGENGGEGEGEGGGQGHSMAIVGVYFMMGRVNMNNFFSRILTSLERDGKDKELGVKNVEGFWR